MKNKEIIVALREYGFPLWAICGCLKLNNNNYERTFEELMSIYCAIGDHPDVVIKRGEIKLRHRIANMGNGKDTTK